MNASVTRAWLAKRRAALREAVRLLEVEILEIDEQLRIFGGRPPPELTEAFFWDQVFPLLLQKGELTSATLRAQLAEKGYPVDERRLRTFLSRYRQRELLQMRERDELRPVWNLTDKAKYQAIQRIDIKR